MKLELTTRYIKDKHFDINRLCLDIDGFISLAYPRLCYNIVINKAVKTVRLDENSKISGDWLDENGQPSAEYLLALVADGSEEALEKLRSIAQDLDVEYDPDTPINVLSDRILTTISGDADEDT